MAEFDPYEYIPELINDEYYIKPGTDVFILRGVPLDNTYEHTIVWENLDADRTQQRDYFLSKVKFGIPANSYQRVDRFWLKVNVNAEYLMDCNYIMFKNTPFNMVKWYYGFITDVEYINNNTSKIRYELDVMQTWLPGQNMDYQMLPCFIERCHAMSDELYENLIPENIVNSDEYMVDGVEEFDMNALSVIALVTEIYIGLNGLGQPVFEPVKGCVKYGTYGAVGVGRWDITDFNGHFQQSELDDLNDFLNQYIKGGKENSVISLQMFPTKFLPVNAFGPHAHIISGTQLFYNNSFKLFVNAPSKNDALGGKNSTFVPKNNKLYSYPYNLIRVNNECGTNKIFKWELFERNTIGVFKIAATETWSPCAVIYPSEYKSIEKNMDNAVVFDNFAICPWSSDAYKAWWAQNSMKVGADLFGGFASMVAIMAGISSDNPMLVATGVGGAVSSGTKIASSLHDATHTSAQSHGSTNTSLILPSINNIKFVVTKESLKPEILELYDDYFTRYGYAQKKIMYPRLVSREHWTYVQTVGFEFNGEINDTDTKKIKSIFDNGITFWRNPNEVGHYELDNKPLV